MSVKLSFDRKKKVPLDTLAAYALAHRSHRDSPLTVSLIQEKQQHDIGMINMDDHETESWAQLLLNIDAMKRLIAFENADPIHLSFHDVRRQFAGFSILEALINDRTLRMEFTPYGDGGSGPGKPVMFLSYTMVELGGVRIGAVASRPVVRDEMIGERRRMDMGPARLLHACVDEGCVIDIRELYLDEVDRLSETYDVMAIGDLMMGISDEVDRELILDRPRLPGHANEAASPRASAA